MSHEVETMAYAGATPWHGLGFNVADTLSPQEILKAAKLDWDVRKVPMKAIDEELDIDLPSSNHYMLVRDNGDKERETVEGNKLPRFMDLGVCGPNYTPFQNEEVFEFFNKFTEAGDMKMETAGSLRLGKMVWALAKVDADFTLAGEDKVGGYLLLSNPHVWGKSATAMFTPVRVVCNNTLTFALRKGKHQAFRMPHMNDFASYKNAAEKALGLSQQIMEQFREASELLSKTRMYTDQRHEFLVRVFQPDAVEEAVNDSQLIENDKVLSSVIANPKDYGDAVQKLVADTIANVELVKNAALAEESIMSSPGSDMDSARGTFWGALNGITHAIDHKVGRDRDASLEQAWFGNRATLKRRALEVATGMAKAA